MVKNGYDQPGHRNLKFRKPKSWFNDFLDGRGQK